MALLKQLWQFTPFVMTTAAAGRCARRCPTHLDTFSNCEDEILCFRNGWLGEVLVSANCVRTYMPSESLGVIWENFFQYMAA